MARAYLLGCPRISGRVLAREATLCLPVYGLFIGAPVLTMALVASAPAPRSWERTGAVALGAVAAAAVLALAVDVGTRFGLRVVPRFERRLEPDPGTYFHGRAVLGRIGRLDALAAARGVPPLTAFGAGAPDLRPGDLWFSSGSGRAAVLAHLDLARAHGLGSGTVRDLERIADALAAAERAGVRFRLVVVAGTAMNALAWDRIRSSGF